MGKEEIINEATVLIGDYMMVHAKYDALLKQLAILGEKKEELALELNEMRIREKALEKRAREDWNEIKTLVIKNISKGNEEDSQT